MSEHPHDTGPPVNRRKTILACVAILVAGAALTAVVYSTEPTATRTSATRSTAMLVDVVPVDVGTYRPEVIAVGTVEPARDVVLSPRVSGEILELGGGFVPGGFVAKGERLLRIDPADYRSALRQQRSALRQAEADLQIEMGRQSVARRDYELLGDSLSTEAEALVLRQPQLNAARARVEAARANVAQARLHLERTDLRAPFDAHILRREANVGSQVSPGQDLGRLVGLDTFWVAASVPLSKVRWLDLPEGSGDTGATVRIRHEGVWPDGAERTGQVHRLIGALEESTRMARVLIAVTDPLARQDPGQPALVIGAFVEARIRAKALEGVVRLARDYVRKDDTVWLMEEGTLRIRPVHVLFRDAEYAYIDRGLADGDRVVTTSLATVIDGADLRTQ